MNRPAGLAEVVGMLDHVNDCCDEITRIVEDGNVREAAERAGQPVPGGAYSSYGGGGGGVLSAAIWNASRAKVKRGASSAAAGKIFVASSPKPALASR